MLDNNSRYDGIYRLTSERESKSELVLPYKVQPFRIGHPLAQMIIGRYKEADMPVDEIEFSYSGIEGKTALLEKIVGQSGWMRVERVSIDSFEQEDHLLIACYTDSGEDVFPEIADRMLMLPAKTVGPAKKNQAVLQNTGMRVDRMKADVLSESANRNQAFFEDEMDKLDTWASDMKVSLEREITDLDAEIKLRKSEAKKMLQLKDKVAAQRIIKDLEKKRADNRQNLYQAQDEVDNLKEELLTKVEKMLEQKVDQKELFTLKWRLV
jgi:hypothetical protein